MAKIIRWTCPECEDVVHFKGLCRECTEYDDAGSPASPIHRVRLNHTTTEYHPHVRTRADFVNSRRKNPSKKQLEAIKEAMNTQSKERHLHHECGEGCEHEEDFHPIGQSIGSEEE
jgi:hypothetical protein